MKSHAATAMDGVMDGENLGAEIDSREGTLGLGGRQDVGSGAGELVAQPTVTPAPHPLRARDQQFRQCPLLPPRRPQHFQGGA